MTEKEKIKLFLENQGISKNRFYQVTGLGIGFLDSGNSLNVDKLKIIINKYPELSLRWIVLDEGEMICTKSDFDLKSFRKANKLSQEKLAEYLGVGQGFISQIESGDRPMPMSIQERILGNKEWIQNDVASDVQHPIDLISAMKDTIEAQKQTIEYQKEIISMLKAQRGIQSKPVKESASSASSHTGV